VQLPERFRKLFASSSPPVTVESAPVDVPGFRTCSPEALAAWQSETERLRQEMRTVSLRMRCVLATPHAAELVRLTTGWEALLHGIDIELLTKPDKRDPFAPSETHVHYYRTLIKNRLQFPERIAASHPDNLIERTYEGLFQVCQEQTYPQVRSLDREANIRRATNNESSSEYADAADLMNAIASWTYGHSGFMASLERRTRFPGAERLPVAGTHSTKAMTTQVRKKSWDPSVDALLSLQGVFWQTRWGMDACQRVLAADPRLIDEIYRQPILAAFLLGTRDPHVVAPESPGDQAKLELACSRLATLNTLAGRTLKPIWIAGPDKTDEPLDTEA
jgi:hypothetical protein